jgi:hypothetical protein
VLGVAGTRGQRHAAADDTDVDDAGGAAARPVQAACAGVEAEARDEADHRRAFSARVSGAGADVYAAGPVADGAPADRRAAAHVAPATREGCS